MSGKFEVSAFCNRTEFAHHPVNAKDAVEAVKRFERIDQDGELEWAVGDVHGERSYNVYCPDGNSVTFSPYLVTGYYKDNDQAFTEDVLAPSPEEARAHCIRKGKESGGDLRVLSIVNLYSGSVFVETEGTLLLYLPNAGLEVA